MKSYSTTRWSCVTVSRQRWSLLKAAFRGRWSFLLFFYLCQTDKHTCNQLCCAQLNLDIIQLIPKKVSKISQAGKHSVLKTVSEGMAQEITSTQTWPYCVLDFKNCLWWVKHQFSTLISLHAQNIFSFLNHLPVFATLSIELFHAFSGTFFIIEKIWYCLYLELFFGENKSKLVL